MSNVNCGAKFELYQIYSLNGGKEKQRENSPKNLEKMRK